VETVGDATPNATNIAEARNSLDINIILLSQIVQVTRTGNLSSPQRKSSAIGRRFIGTTVGTA
jgi:hypothetical protein